MTPLNHPAVHKAFRQAVNMTPGAIEKWLRTDASKAVGFVRRGETESVGRQSGRRIVAILRKNKTALTDADYAHMRKVVGYVKRHLAQRPRGDVTRARWRYSLMNWGHDPLRRRRVTSRASGR